MRAWARITSLIVAPVSMWGCKAVIDASDYEIDDQAFVSCGEVEPVLDKARVRGCINTVSCNPFEPPYTVSECLTLDPLQKVVGERASYFADCDVYGSKFAFSYSMEECVPDVEACDGQRLVICRAERGFKATIEDCSKREATCDDSIGKCVIDVACDADTGPACSENRLYRCIDGVAVGGDCQYGSCEIFRGSPECTVHSAPVQCDGAYRGKQWCVGNTANSCDEEGNQYSYDCEAQGLVCNPDVGGVCVAEGCGAADYIGCGETCDAATGIMTVCVGGVPVLVSCAEYGFRTCQQKTHESRPDVGQYVRCIK